MGPTPLVLTPQFLNHLKTHKALPQNSWYFIAGVTLSALNLSHEIPKILTHALEDGPGPPDKPASGSKDDQRYIARRLREGLIKSAAVVGLPKVSPVLHVRDSLPDMD